MRTRGKKKWEKEASEEETLSETSTMAARSEGQGRAGRWMSVEGVVVAVACASRRREGDHSQMDGKKYPFLDVCLYLYRATRIDTEIKSISRLDNEPASLPPYPPHPIPHPWPGSQVRVLSRRDRYSLLLLSSVPSHSSRHVPLR